LWDREVEGAVAVGERSFAGANDTPPCHAVGLRVEDGAPGSVAGREADSSAALRNDKQKGGNTKARSRFLRCAAE